LDSGFKSVKKAVLFNEKTRALGIGFLLNYLFSENDFGSRVPESRLKSAGKSMMLQD
jgi:hypothetical protein